MGEGFRIIKDISKIAAGVAVALTTVNGCAPTPVRCVPQILLILRQETRRTHENY